MKSNCKVCAIKSKAVSKLSAEQIEKLSFSCALVKLRKGDSLIRQETFSTNVAYLRSGLAKIHIAGPYHEQIVRIVKAPSYLGLPTTFGDKKKAAWGGRACGGRDSVSDGGQFC